MSSSGRETWRRIGLGTWIRAGAFVVLVVAGILTIRFSPLGEILTREGMTAFVGELRTTWWSPLALLGLYILVGITGLLPSPLVVGGALFGATSGTIYNTLGLLLGAAVGYALARILGRDFIVRLTGPRVRRVEHALRKHGFWPLVQTRFLPIPFALVNFGSALAGVPLSRFLLATVIGIVPATLLHTYFLATLLTADEDRRVGTLAAYVATFALFNIAISTIWLRRRFRRRRRYREILERRSSRNAARVPEPARSTPSVK
jgi:uncharacterized membrane protein YdjX (TVP38/TMEM64 family)